MARTHFKPPSNQQAKYLSEVLGVRSVIIPEDELVAIQPMNLAIVDEPITESTRELLGKMFASVGIKTFEVVEAGTEIPGCSLLWVFGQVAATVDSERAFQLPAISALLDKDAKKAQAAKRQAWDVIKVLK